jgi:queuine tRNA-ribosyltransferase
MTYKIQIFENGEATLKDLRMGESMHSSIGPWVEAQEIYLNQSYLTSKLALKNPEPIILFDLGLGLAANALASLELFFQTPSERSLIIFSFENSYSGLEYALENKNHFPFLVRHETLVRNLLKKRVISEKTPRGTSFQWHLVDGDFKHNLSDKPAPEIIYYDLYSPKVCPLSWGYECFRNLFEATQSLRKQGRETSLITYSSSTAVRAAMFLAGFYVGYGVATSKKKETTVASTNPNQLMRPLGQEWFQHWTRSSKPLPEDYPEQNLELISQKLKRVL